MIVHQGMLDEDVHLVAKPFNFQDLARKIVEVLKTGEGSAAK